MMALSKEWLTPAKTSLKNAQRELVYAVRALERTGRNFEATINEIKQVIGDLEIAITAFEEDGE